MYKLYKLNHSKQTPNVHQSLGSISALRYKRGLACFTAFLCLSMSMPMDAAAKRMSGGRSFGKQSSNVTQRQAPAPAPAAPHQATAPSAAPNAPTAAPTAAPNPATAARPAGASRWLGPLAGIAAGVGLAALLSHMGLGGAAAEFIGTLLLIMLVVGVAVFLFRRFRGNANASALNQENLTPAWQGAATHYSASPAPDYYQDNKRTVAGQGPISYQSEPPAVTQAGSTGPVPYGDSTVAASATWSIPAGFDVENFLANAKKNFLNLQNAWDSGQTHTLREFMTDELFTEIQPQITAQKASADLTQVILLNAELLGVETQPQEYLASIRFSGMISEQTREQTNEEAKSFAEVWNLVKSRNGNSGWLLAGIQQLN